MYKAYAVSWNLTRRCNLFCAHCYLSAAPGAESAGELSTEECRVMADIARVNPHAFLILTGGSRSSDGTSSELAARGREHGFTVVLGTNGVLLHERQARLMREYGVQGASVSLDSTDPARHDLFRHLPGAWQGAMRATEALRAEGLDFAIHMSVTDWNVGEIPGMIDLAMALGARVLNFFFLVRTGRGERLTDITPIQYEEILGYLARAQGLGAEPAAATPSVFEGAEDPWSVPAGRAGGLLIRAKCAPHCRRILWQLDPRRRPRQLRPRLLPGGKYYRRITPTGDATPLHAGLRRQPQTGRLPSCGGAVFDDQREPWPAGAAGRASSSLSGGCRCRAYATSGDYLAGDPAELRARPAEAGIRLPAERTSSRRG
jgi:MoaA/NifB/PqqE/SkfB family radical SAM enzyme